MSNTNMYPPAWHRVPDSNQERYWDGTRWTDAFRPFEFNNLNNYQNLPSGDRFCGQAIAAMILGICSLLVVGFGFLLGIVGIIFASISFKKCRPRGPYKGRGMAISGLICSIISVALWTVFISIMTGA